MRPASSIPSFCFPTPTMHFDAMQCSAAQSRGGFQLNPIPVGRRSTISRGRSEHYSTISRERSNAMQCSSEQRCSTIGRGEMQRLTALHFKALIALTALQFSNTVLQGRVLPLPLCVRFVQCLRNDFPLGEKQK